MQHNMYTHLRKSSMPHTSQRATPPYCIVDTVVYWVSCNISTRLGGCSSFGCRQGTSRREGPGFPGLQRSLQQAGCVWRKSLLCGLRGLRSMGRACRGRGEYYLQGRYVHARQLRAHSLRVVCCGPMPAAHQGAPGNNRVTVST